MGLAVDSTSQAWPQVFRQLVVTNCRYWLNCAQEDVNRLLPETPQVLKGLNYALHLTEAWQWARDLILCLSPLMLRQGQGVKWERFLTQSITCSAAEKDPAEIELRLQLGNLYRLQGQLPEARACLKEAVELCEQYEVRTHYWALMNHLGLVARLSAEHEEALTYCQQVLSEQNAAASERAEALNVMGLVVYDRRQWEEALSYFDQALGLYRSLGDSYQIARILNNRGLVLLRDGNWDKAQESYQEAIEQFRVSDDQAESFKAVMNLGNVFLMKEEYKAAIEQYQQALPIFQQCNYLVDLAYIYNNLGLASTGLTDWEVAEAYFLAALESWRNLGGDAYNQANVLDNLGDMFIKANQLENANEVLRQALQLLGAIPDSPARTYLQGEIEGRLTKLKDSL